MENINYKILFRKISCVSLIYLFFIIIGISIGFDESQTNKVSVNTSFNAILINNSIALAVNILGFFTFGISTFMNLASNGFIHGISIKHYYDLNGMVKTCYSVLPHGIFEIPGIVVSSTIGMYPMFWSFSCIRNKKITFNIKATASTLIFLTIVSYLLIIVGAFIEINLINILRRN